MTIIQINPAIHVAAKKISLKFVCYLKSTTSMKWPFAPSLLFADMWLKKNLLIQSYIIYVLEYINCSCVSTNESFKTLSSYRK